MKKEEYSFIEGQYVYCSRIPGIHLITKIINNGENRAPTLYTEHIYNSSYEKINKKTKDREYIIDGMYCKLIDFKKLFSFESSKFEKIKTVILKLDPYAG